MWKRRVHVNSPSYVIDGDNFTTLEGFFDEVGRMLASRENWDRKTRLAALNDILSWPSLESGRPNTLIWKNSARSKERLGHGQMCRKLEQMLQTCHASNVASISERLQTAREQKGPTLFEWLVEIIRENQEYAKVRLE
jgi:RNAse (barnase) inhibitor barstar